MMKGHGGGYCSSCVVGAVLNGAAKHSPRTHSACTPLRWIRVHEAAFGLVTARASDPNLLRLVEGAVRLGTPLLLDELPEGSLPTGLDGLLQQRPAADQRQGRTLLCCIIHRLRNTAVPADAMCIGSTPFRGQ